MQPHIVVKCIPTRHLTTASLSFEIESPLSEVLYQVCIYLFFHSDCFPCIEISDPLLCRGTFSSAAQMGKLWLEESALVKAVVALRTWPRANSRPWCLMAHFSAIIPKPLVYMRNLDLLIFPDQWHLGRKLYHFIITVLSDEHVAYRLLVVSVSCLDWESLCCLLFDLCFPIM